MKYIILLLFPFFCSAHIGVISDLHAGSLKIRRNSNQSVVYPRLAVKYFDKALAQMNGKVDFVVALGDITQRGEKKYYKQLKKVENKRGIKVIWIKGNHDDNDFKIMGGYEKYTQDGLTFQHIPPLNRYTCDPTEKIEGTILAGHWHMEKDCGNVKVFPALTEHKKLNYRIYDINHNR